MTQGVAYLRVEDILVDRGVLAAAAFFSANAQGFGERLFRLSQVAVAAPLFGLLSQNDRGTSTRMAWLSLRGMTEDRLAVLAEEYLEERLAPRILDGGLALLKRLRREKRKVVLLSESIEQLARPLADRLAAQVGAAPYELICNRLELRRGEVSGSLLDPLVGDHDGGALIKRHAAEHGYDLGQASAYAAHGPDLLLLAAVGRPCAVNPDYTLRKAARASGWPLLDYRPGSAWDAEPRP